MAVIKIDNKLHKAVKEFIKKGDNRFDYPTVKAFIDKCVFIMLKKKTK